MLGWNLPHLWYDRKGRPIPMEAWGPLHADKSYQVLAQHWVRGWKVSTIWLGLDHSFGEGPPVIFETMIFAPKDEHAEEDAERDGLDGYQWRYSTEAEAFAGHDRAKALVCAHVGVTEDQAVTEAEFANVDPESWAAELETLLGQVTDEEKQDIRRELGWDEDV